MSYFLVVIALNSLNRKRLEISKIVKLVIFCSMHISSTYLPIFNSVYSWLPTVSQLSLNNNKYLMIVSLKLLDYFLFRNVNWAIMQKDFWKSQGRRSEDMQTCWGLRKCQASNIQITEIWFKVIIMLSINRILNYKFIFNHLKIGTFVKEFYTFVDVFKPFLFLSKPYFLMIIF